MSIWMRARASLWLRGSIVSSFRLLSALLSHTRRCSPWWVACGQRAASHMLIRGLLSGPMTVPARRRHRALAGSRNQQ